MVVETTEKKTLNWLKGADGTLTIKYAYANNSTETIYTVPTGKVYLIIAADLSYWTDEAALGDVGLLEFAGNEVMNLACTNITSDGGVETMNFIPPVRLTAGQTVQVTSNSTQLSAQAHVIGYLISA